MEGRSARGPEKLNLVRVAAILRQLAYNRSGPVGAAHVSHGQKFQRLMKS
jgi:hypothetical protein